MKIAHATMCLVVGLYSMNFGLVLLSAQQTSQSETQTGDRTSSVARLRSRVQELEQELASMFHRVRIPDAGISVICNFFALIASNHP